MEYSDGVHFYQLAQRFLHAHPVGSGVELSLPLP